jgi:hypothetical protein
MTAPGGALPGERACDSGTGTAVIAPGSELSLRVTTVQTTVQNTQFGWRATTL